MRRRRVRSLVVISLAIVAGLISAEMLARFVLGLGTPPLSVGDPTIEYMFKPNQDVKRFGNRQFFNEFGMRSEPIYGAKPSNEFRILAIGDFVLNGGSLTDHNDLATTILSRGGIRVLNVQIPTKPAMHSNLKPAVFPS